MKTPVAFSVLAAVFLLTSGCASHRYSILEPASKPLTSYRILEIKDFRSNLRDSESIELSERFADQLYREILNERQLHPDEVIFDEVVRETDETSGVLVLEGTVISYERGSRAARYFIGFGAGKAYCTIQATFTDKKTGEQILKSNFDGELAMGIFGGSASQTVQGVVESFIDYFANYFETEVSSGTEKRYVGSESSGEAPAKEKQQLAYVPVTAARAKVSLRKEPRMLRETAIEKMVLRHDFYDSLKNTLGSFENDFIDNGDGTVTDKATGLMWQKGGSTKSMSRKRANTYVSMLNRNKSAGYRNWRLPTSEELATLLESTETNGVHIDPLFKKRQKRCWSSDMSPSTTDVGFTFEQGWMVSFAEGQVRIARWVPRLSYGVRSRQINPSNWVKAVRSVK